MGVKYLPLYYKRRGRRQYELGRDGGVKCAPIVFLVDFLRSSEISLSLGSFNRSHEEPTFSDREIPRNESIRFLRTSSQGSSDVSWMTGIYFDPVVLESVL